MDSPLRRLKSAVGRRIRQQARHLSDNAQRIAARPLRAAIGDWLLWPLTVGLKEKRPWLTYDPPLPAREPGPDPRWLVMVDATTPLPERAWLLALQERGLVYHIDDHEDRDALALSGGVVIDARRRDAPQLAAKALSSGREVGGLVGQAPWASFSLAERAPAVSIESEDPDACRLLLGDEAQCRQWQQAHPETASLIEARLRRAFSDGALALTRRCRLLAVDDERPLPVPDTAALASASAAAPRTRRKRVLIVNTLSPASGFGGSTQVVARQLDAWRGREEIDIQVLSADPGGIDDWRITEEACHGFRVTRIGVPTQADADAAARIDDRGVYDDLLAALAPDLVHVHSLQRLGGRLIEAINRAGIPWWVSLHDAWWLSPQQFACDAAGRRSDAPYRADQLVNAGGEDALMRADYLAALLGTAARRLAVSPTQQALYRAAGIDCEVFDNGVPHPAAPPKPPPEKPLRMLYLGGLVPHKGADWLRAACEAVDWPPDATMTVVDFSRRQAAGTRWGSLSVTLIPQQTPAQVGALYAGHNLVLCPSLAPESYGLVAREALLAGCRVIVSDAGALAELPADQTRLWQIPAGDVAGLAELLQSLQDAGLPAPPERYPAIADAAEQARHLYDDYLHSGTPANDAR